VIITAPARDLARAATAAFTMATEKSTVAILGNLLLTPGDGAVSFSGTNLDGCATGAVPAEVTDMEPASVVVDGRIAKLLSSLPGDALVKLSYDMHEVDALPLVVTCGRSRYRVDTLSPDDFPPLLTAGDEVLEFTLSDAARRRLFTLPTAVIDDSDPRIYLQGLHLKSVGRRLVAAGNDGHRLIRVSVEELADLPPDGVIVPLKACTAIAKMDGCVIRVSERAIEARTDSCCFAHNLIAARYPSYEQCIPEPSGNSVELDRLELIEALKRLLLVAERGNAKNVVVPVAALRWGDDELSLTLSKQADVGADSLHAVTNGTGKTGVRISAFVELLAATPGEIVRLDAAAERGAAVKIISPNDADFAAIAMPCVY
jgi:DNA polymerase III subunit beta